MVTSEQASTVMVTGVGTVDATPDAVSIDLAVQVGAPDPAASMRQAAEQLEKLLGVLDAARVTSADRQTTGMRSNPSWDHERNVESGFETSYSLHVVVDDLGGAGALVERAAQECGTALRLHGFALLVRDPEPHLRVAREQAVLACRSQAEQLAAAAGCTLGRLVLLREGGDGPRAARLEHMSIKRPSGIAVEPGEQGMTVVVTATYELAD